MFKRWFKKVPCDICGRDFKKSKLINYGGINICSMTCMEECFKNLTTEELLTLEQKDREVNPDFHKWIGGGVR